MRMHAYYVQDYHYERGLLFWSDSVEKKIFRSKFRRHQEESKDPEERVIVVDKKARGLVFAFFILILGYIIIETKYI